MVARTVDIMGIEHVGIGTGRRYNGTPEQLDWARMGRWTRHKDFGAAAPGKGGLEPSPAWCENLEDLGRIGAGLAGIGFSPAETRLILRDNWMRLFRTTLR
jgi:microsomal dipeptidase-like Zn-dependent dipeptidase